jgi:hypothetical protein
VSAKTQRGASGSPIHMSDAWVPGLAE